MTKALIDDILRDRETGTEDHWWPDRIGDYTRDMAEHGDQQDIADKARIMRLPAIERALIAAQPLIEAMTATRAALIEAITASRELEDHIATYRAQVDAVLKDRAMIMADRDRLLRLTTMKGQTDDPRP